MPKNKGKGGKNRKRGKNVNIEEAKRELVYKEDGQDYGQVIRMLGGGHLEALCFGDGKTRVCHIRGKMRKKIWVNKGDVVLLGLRHFEDSKADIILKYSNEEARELQRQCEIPHLTSESIASNVETKDDIIFVEEASDTNEESSANEEEEEEEEEENSFDDDY